MNRERTAWLLSFLLLAVVAFRSPSSAQRYSDYLLVRTLVDINRQVVGNYVEPVEAAKLEQAAIDGMLEQLDPFTVYIPPAQREEFDRRLEGTFKAGKAEGPGFYISATGTRYEGPFERGKLAGAKPEDCPATRGPLSC